MTPVPRRNGPKWLRRESVPQCSGSRPPQGRYGRLLRPDGFGGTSQLRLARLPRPLPRRERQDRRALGRHAAHPGSGRRPARQRPVLTPAGMKREATMPVAIACVELSHRIRSHGAGQILARASLAVALISVTASIAEMLVDLYVLFATD